MIIRQKVFQRVWRNEFTIKNIHLKNVRLCNNFINNKIVYAYLIVCICGRNFSKLHADVLRLQNADLVNVGWNKSWGIQVPDDVEH